MEDGKRHTENEWAKYHDIINDNYYNVSARYCKILLYITVPKLWLYEYEYNMLEYVEYIIKG